MGDFRPKIKRSLKKISSVMALQYSAGSNNDLQDMRQSRSREIDDFEHVASQKLVDFITYSGDSDHFTSI